MSLQALLHIGAETVAGRVFYKREEVGFFHNGEFIMTAAGEARVRDLPPVTPPTRNPRRSAPAEAAAPQETPPDA